MFGGFLSGVTAVVVLGGSVLGPGAIAPGSIASDSIATVEAAVSSGVQVSTDGTHFSSTLQGSVFPSTTVMIPGSVKTATLYVKNDSAVPSQLFVSAGDIVASSPQFAHSLSLQASSPVAPGRAPATLDFGHGCVTLLSQQLAPGAVTRLTLTLAMSDVAGHVAQGDSIAATLGLALREADTSVAPVDTCDLSGVQLPVLGLPVPASGWSLAFTGSTILYPALMAVGVLLAAGTWLVLAGRRRKRQV